MNFVDIGVDVGFGRRGVRGFEQRTVVRSTYPGYRLCDGELVRMNSGIMFPLTFMLMLTTPLLTFSSKLVN